MSLAEMLPTIRINTQAIEIMKQGKILQLIYGEMDEVWLHLHTTDKRCPIVEEIGTIVKRRLIRQYIIGLVKEMRSMVNVDIINKTIDPDANFWIADDIARTVADNKVEDHFHLFCSLVSAIFGTSIRLVHLMMKDEVTLNELYGVLNDTYTLTLNDPQNDGVITVEMITERLEGYINGEDAPIFEAVVY